MIELIKEKIEQCRTELNSYSTMFKMNNDRIKELQFQMNTIGDCQKILQEVALSCQSTIKQRIEKIVNLGLSVCFPDYDFCLDFVENRNKTEVKFVVRHDGKDVDVMLQNGGGLIDVLAFSLRIAIYSIVKNDNVIILDEPFKFVSKDLRANVSKMLSVLSSELNLQVIMVTHIDELVEMSDNRIIVKKENGVSNVQTNRDM